MLCSVITIVYRVKQIVYFSTPYLMNTRGTSGVRWLTSIFFCVRPIYLQISSGIHLALLQQRLFLPYIFYGGQVADSAKIALRVT